MEAGFGGAVTVWVWIVLVNFWPLLLSGLFLAWKRKSLQQKWTFFFAGLGVCYVAQLFAGLALQTVTYITQKPIGLGRTGFMTMWAIQLAVAAVALLFASRKMTAPVNAT